MRQGNLDNALARFTYLKSALERPEGVPTYVLDAISGQAKFAALSVPNKFSSMSLNTLKSAAEVVLRHEGSSHHGWALLESLRKELQQKAKKTKSRTAEARKAKRQAETDNIKFLLHQAERSGLIKTKAYLDLYSRIAALTKSQSIEPKTKALLDNLLDDHRILFGSLFDPTPTDSGSATLSVIKGGKK